MVIQQKSTYTKACYPDRQLFWSIWPSDKFVKNSTKQLALKLPVIESSTVPRYVFHNFRSGVVERFRRRYILKIVTGEIQTGNAVYFQRKILLSGFSAHPNGSPSQLIQISGVLLYMCFLI